MNMWPFTNKKKKLDLLKDFSYVTSHAVEFHDAVMKVRKIYPDFMSVKFEVDFLHTGEERTEVRIYLGSPIAESISFKSVNCFIANVDKVLAYIDLHKITKELQC